MKSSYLCLLACLSLFCCEPVVPDQEEEYALLRSNEIQRQAHMENDAALLVGEVADSMFSVQNGQVNVSSRKAIEERFETYFQQVLYTSWDDIRPPVIQVSPDGKQATVMVEKLIDAQSKDSTGQYGPHSYIQFAWTAEYSKENGSWKLYANTSTRKDLTEAEAEVLPIHMSTQLAILPEKELIPEGVAHDHRTGITYLSSTYLQKIVGVQTDGTSFDFKSSGEDGLWSTVGMEVDEDRRRLWVVSSNAHEVLPMRQPDPKTHWSSRVYEYDLETGSFIGRHKPVIEGPFSFNDLTVSKDGQVYVSESLNNKVYQLNPEDGQFTTLEIKDSLFVFPNGITLSEDQQYLYIACRYGILQYHLERNTYRMLLKPEAVVDHRLDGLAYYQGTLIGNQSYRKRIMQYYLDEPNGLIRYQKILEANNPHFDQPATGEIAGDHFIYLANAQMQSGFSNGKIRPEEELDSIRLMKVRLW